MKSCSFRGALPPSDSEGLFCGRNEPQSRYTLTACGHPTCLCCHPINHERRSEVWPVVDFHSSSMHQFLNGYRTYLNCPAVSVLRYVQYFPSFQFRHAIQAISSIPWHVHVVSMIMLIQQQKHWLKHWLVSIILIDFNDIHTLLIYICIDHREHGNSIIHEKLVGSRSFRGIELDPEEQK